MLSQIRDLSEESTIHRGFGNTGLNGLNLLWQANLKMDTLLER